MGTQKEFYEKYWNDRHSKGRIHTKNEVWIPVRINIAVRMIIENIEKFKQKERISVLDVGCGEGTVGKLLRKQLKNKILIFGCDISETILMVLQYLCLKQYMLILLALQAMFV